MGKSKLTSLETFMEMNLCEAKVVRYNGISWPYMINNSGTIWTTPFTEVRPFLDSKTGFLTVNLESRDESCTVPLHILMAHIYLPNENGFTNARLKAGSKSDLSSYCKSNIEWCEDVPTDKEHKDEWLNELDLATVVWCKMRLAFKDYQIANELGISVDVVNGLLRKYDQQFINDFKFKDNPSKTSKNKVKTIRPFMIYLMNIGKDNHYVVNQARLLVPEVELKYITDVVSYVRRKPEFPIKDEYRKNPK